MLIKKLIIGLLSFYAIDVTQRKLAKAASPFPETQVERLYESVRRQIKKKEKSYDNRKWKSKKRYKSPTLAFKESKPRDVRYSNQKMIRRMFRNS